MKIGIIVAMDKEFAQLKAILSNTETKHFNHKDFVTGRLGDKEIILQQCGIGKVNSAIGAVEMINHYHPDLVISSGCAGGADTSLEVTDVVVATECAYMMPTVAMRWLMVRLSVCLLASRLLRS